MSSVPRAPSSCEPALNLSDCSSPADWTGPDNISNTALQSIINADWTGDTDGNSARTPFHGDSPQPNIFSAGFLEPG